MIVEVGLFKRGRFFYPIIGIYMKYFRYLAEMEEYMGFAYISKSE